MGITFHHYYHSSIYADKIPLQLALVKAVTALALPPIPEFTPILLHILQENVMQLPLCYKIPEQVSMFLPEGRIFGDG